MDTNKFGRLLLHATKVKTEPYQSPETLWNSLGTGKAQYYRDKEALKKTGFIYSYSRQQRRFVIQEEPYLPVYDLTMTEMLALTLAVRQLSAAGDFILTYDALEAIKKMIANAQGEQREMLNTCLNETVLKEGFGCQRHILEELTRAVQTSRQVTIAYTRPTDEAPHSHTLNPYQIYFKRRALYLDAYSPKAGKDLVFRVNRISEVRPTPAQFTRRPEYNFSQRHQHAFSVFVGDEVQPVRVRFAKQIALFIREACWHHSQRLTEEQDGSLLFEVEVSEPREVGWWVLQWGAGAEVLEPESLRQELRETAEQLVELYADSQPSEEKQ